MMMGMMMKILNGRWRWRLATLHLLHDSSNLMPYPAHSPLNFVTALLSLDITHTHWGLSSGSQCQNAFSAVEDITTSGVRDSQ